MIRALVRTFAIAEKEATHIRRDPQTLGMALGMPAAMLLLFGYGVSFDLDHLPVALVDEDHTHDSRAFAQAFGAPRELEIVARRDTAEGATQLFRDGTVAAVVVIPHGFSRHLARGEPASVQVVIDGADGSIARQLITKSEALVAGARLALLHRGVVPRAPVAVLSWTRFNPTGRSALLLVPGIIAYVLAMVAVLLTALTVAREWERGSMEQLFTTPVGRLEIVVGKLLPYVVLCAVAVLLVLAVGAWVFEVPIRGSLWTLAFASLLFLAGMLGQGLLISTIARNQMVATQAGALSSMLPSMLLSGFMFPIENMPMPLQILANILPSSHFVTVLRGVLLRGNGVAELWVHLGAMAIFACATIGLASLVFRRTLD